MSKPKTKANRLDFECDENGIMLDNRTPFGSVVFCDTEHCEAPAVSRVAVSVQATHDETRNYCSCCSAAYWTGVQHGRWHEAARLQGESPGRDNSQVSPCG